MLTTRCNEFDKLLQAAVDDALISLGEAVRQAIYFHIESKFNVPQSKVPENLEAFQLGLEKIFGAGARFIEILILKSLHLKTGLQLELDVSQLEFKNYVDAAEQSYIQSKVARINTGLCEELDTCIK